MPSAVRCELRANIAHGLEYGGAQRVAAEKRQLLDHELDPHRFRAIVVIETEATALLRQGPVGQVGQTAYVGDYWP